ncbi:hypothetical protein I4U23_015983 [Adineta vaga]|nr:hypothetical protein I4U23_015983 [Adineta vaga]
MSFIKNETVSMPPLLIDSECELYVDEPVYNPDIYLSLTEPDFAVLLDGFQRVPKAPQLSKSVAANGESQIAYSGPFRLLSDAGYRIFREILKREMVHQISDARHPAKIRYSGYRSKWIQDFNRCSRVLEHLSCIAGDVQFLPTTLQSSYSQINIGYAGGDQIDAYHRDSVPQTIGGELQLIERDPEEAFRLIEQYKGQVPTEFVRTIDYLGSNSCVFMQGSRIVHRVTGIQSCTEPRIIMVNSYMSANPFVTETTRYDTFRNEKTAPLEFAMHKMWRANIQLLSLGSGKYSWPTKDQVIEQISKSIEELDQCRKILMDKTSDRVGFYNEKNQKIAFIKNVAIPLNTDQHEPKLNLHENQYNKN